MSKCVTSGFVNVVMSAFHLRSKEPHAGVGSGLIYVLASEDAQRSRQRNQRMVCFIYFNLKIWGKNTRKLDQSQLRHFEWHILDFLF